MALSVEDDYVRLLRRANAYHREARWEEKLRCLQAALAVCESPELPKRDERKQSVLFDIAGIWRRLGQYDKAKHDLRASLDAFPASSLFQASVEGEIGVMARHNNQFFEAQQAFHEQARLASEAPPSLEADAEICRAVGNQGRAAFNLWQQMDEPRDLALLETATTKIRDRISRAQKLQERLPPTSKIFSQAETWEIIGLDCLAVLLVAADKSEEAVRVATESQRKQKREDPTVTAFSKFFYGYALWHDGQKQKALNEWNAPNGTCSAPMALCKEPSEEHNGYLKLMADAGVDFDTFDESGFSALDHAVLGTSADAAAAVPIIKKALRVALTQNIQSRNTSASSKTVDMMVNDEITLRMRQAELRRQYRTILQERIRPELRSNRDDSFRKLRDICADFIATDERQVFSRFHFVRYPEFKKHGKLPASTSGLARLIEDTSSSQDPVKEDFIVFFSYRWIGGNKPDDDNGTQWRRMSSAIEEFLHLNPHIEAERVCLWLDYACIDQIDDEERRRGVDALPLAVTQCNALISLIDDTYYSRAWCVVEVLLMKALVESYGLHQWWEHSDAGLKRGDSNRSFDVSQLQLTKEKLDRPKIDFLLRQSKLMGKDSG